MSAVSDPSQRLAELERILERARTAIGSASGDRVDPALLHLASAPIERIRRLTEDLRSRSRTDEISGVTMRLLLDDFATAVGHLRAVARMADARIEEAAAPIREVRDFVHHEQKQWAKGAPS